MALLNKVFIKDPKHSNFDLSHKLRTTMAPGYIYPILCEELVPGDMINLSIDGLVKTYPLLAPLMGRFKLQCDCFFVATRLYCPELRNNNLNFDPSAVDIPYTQLPCVGYSDVYDTDDDSNIDGNMGSANGDIDSGSDGGTSGTFVANQVANNSLMAYLGVAPNSCYVLNPSDIYTFDSDLTSNGVPKINAIPFLGYLDIFRNYYANTQEDTFIIPRAYDSTGTSNYYSYNLSLLDDLFDWVQTGTSKFIDDFFFDKLSTTYASYISPYWSCSSGAGGLLVKTYLPDMNTAYLNSGTYSSMVTTAKVDTSSDSFTVNQMRFANKLMKYLERSIVSGGRFDDWLQAQFGVSTDSKLDIPEFLGSSSTYISFNEIVQTAGYDASDPTNSTLGTLGGRGISSLNSRKHRFRATENGYLMVMCSITPMVDYYQGIKPYLMKTNYMDFFAPAFDNIGFQTTPTSQLCSVPLTYNTDYAPSKYVSSEDAGTFTNSFGYQPAWTEYMTNVNRILGDFTDSLNYWTLSRDYIEDTNAYGLTTSTSVHVTTYIKPYEYNYAFVDTSLQAENFLCQFNFDLFAKRPISKQIMPSL